MRAGIAGMPGFPGETPFSLQKGIAVCGTILRETFMPIRRLYSCLADLAFLSFIFVRVAAASDEAAPVLPPRTDSPPVIDGSLNDPTWQSAPLNPHFMTYFPTYGDSLPQKTWVWIAYDDQKLYFAFRCEYTEPLKIKTSISQRDRIFSDDWVGVSVDALGNRQSSVEFFVNPNGMQGDILNSSNQGEDTAPDYVWESAGRLSDGGYEVEIAVPLRTLRFKSGREVDMNLVFMRRISRMGTSGSWPELKPGDGYLNQHMPVRFRDLSAPLNLEVLPSATYSDRRERSNPGAWARPEREGDFGVGVKYGLTSSIVTDLTYNPDFSQVESDAFQAEVNRRYPVFYSEKRPFFMEGMDIFDFVLIPEGMMSTPVHTRRIVDPGWGAKLSGSTGKTAFGLIASGDDFPGYVWEDEKNPNEGKKARFGIARVRRSLKGENYAGLLYSSRFFDGLSNQVIGADIKLLFGNGMQFNSSVLGSATVDSAGTAPKKSLGLNAWLFRETRHFECGTGFDHYGKTFAMETAFLRRTGVSHGWAYAGINAYPAFKKAPWWKRNRFQIIYDYAWDHETRRLDQQLIVNNQFTFTRMGYFGLEVDAIREAWKGRIFPLTQFWAFGQVQAFKWLRFGGMAASGEWIYYEADPPEKGAGRRVNLNVTLQPGDKVALSLGGYAETLLQPEDRSRIYTVSILNTKLTYQLNKYFMLRGIVRYEGVDQEGDGSRRVLLDFLASFTFIPGTVLHLGYGSLYEKNGWENGEWTGMPGRYYEMSRGLFLKASYLWRY